jgi:predicted ATP-dependent protease
VVDIEREAKLGGRVHSKGVMILTGFLAGRYAPQHPLALSASLTFEQQYEEVEGDSASSAELYALLSSLAGIPLAQGIAVTGSVNQRGEIQPVGTSTRRSRVSSTPVGVTVSPAARACSSPRPISVT